MSSLALQSGAFVSSAAALDIYGGISTITTCGGIDFTDSIVTLHDNAYITNEFGKITVFPDRLNSVSSAPVTGGPVDTEVLGFNLKSFAGIAAFETWLQENITSGMTIKNIFYAEGMRKQIVMWETGGGGGGG